MRAKADVENALRPLEDGCFIRPDKLTLKLLFAARAGTGAERGRSARCAVMESAYRLSASVMFRTAGADVIPHADPMTIAQNARW